MGAREEGGRKDGMGRTAEEDGREEKRSDAAGEHRSRLRE